MGRVGRKLVQYRLWRKSEERDKQEEHGAPEACVCVCVCKGCFGMARAGAWGQA